MGELLDFKDQGNFDFFKFSSRKSSDQEFQRSLKSKCEHVLEYAHETVQDMCLLGYHLKELKESGKWQWVFNPETGYCFDGGSFGEFCAYAFSFSRTRTSDLLRISKFVQISGTKNGFLPEKYKGYNTSQLVELSSVEDGRLHYFNPDMKVEEMRLLKRYFEWGSYWDERREAEKNGEDFNALERAKAWKEREDRKKNPQPLVEVLEGQITLADVEEREDIEEDFTEETVEDIPEESEEDMIENPTSDFADDCQEDNDEEEREIFDTECDDFDSWLEKQPEGTFVQGGGLDSDFIEDQMPLLAHDEEVQKNPTSDLAEESEAEKYRFGARAYVRDFLSDYKAWAGRCGHFFLSPCYCYSLRNGAVIYAMTYDSYIDFVENMTTKRVIYFLQEKGKSGAIELSKEQFERWCSEHKQEL